MEPAKLKLADYNKPLTRSPDALYFERRHTLRRRLRCRVTALVSDRRQRRDDHRICSLDLRDQSDTGLGAVADVPVPVGRTVTVFFPPHGPERGFDMIGTVVRCQQQDDHYSIGISLAQRLAA